MFAFGFARLFRRISNGGNINRFVNRRGFSLIEVILSTALLMGSVIVLARLAGMGRTTANKAELLSIAQARCEQTLHEIVLGLRTSEPVQDQPLLPVETVSKDASSFAAEFDFNETPADSESLIDEPAWKYSVLSENFEDLPGLRSITVVVRQARSVTSRPVEFSLTRWVTAPSESDTTIVDAWDLGDDRQ